MVPLKDPSVYTDVQMCQTVPPLQTDTPPPVEEVVCQLKCIMILVILSTLYLKNPNQNSFIYHTTKANQMLRLHSGGGTAAQ